MNFYHSNGAYNIPVSSNTSESLTSTCNFPLFTLPSSGYSWKYTIEGNIFGYVTVSGLDSDGYNHEGSTYVEYTQQYPYPAMVYHYDKSISTAEPDVKAHYKIELQNTQILSGSSITFKAGNTINIADNVIFQEGSLTNLIIDHSMQN